MELEEVRLVSSWKLSTKYVFFNLKIYSYFQLADTKTADNQTTLLHYLCQIMEHKFPELGNNLLKDFSQIEASSKISYSTVVTDINELKTGLGYL